MVRPVNQENCRNYLVSSKLEWLLTNSIGGYAMGTVSGANTRRYHGHLVAATDPPDVRTVLLAGIEAYVTCKGETHGISTNQYVGTIHPQGFTKLKSFSCNDHAEWTFDLNGQEFIKRLAMHDRSNAITVSYTNEGTDSIQLTLRPLVCHKFYHENFRVTDFYPEYLVFPDDKTVLEHHGNVLCLNHPNADRTATTGWYYRFEHPRESERGLDAVDDLFCPCELRYLLAPSESATLVASTAEDVPPLTFKSTSLQEENIVHALETSAKKFFVRTHDRTGIIAGYPWFTDWGRDTMIALPGVCLETGNTHDAREILRSYAGQMRQGILPNRFEDQGNEPEYNTVDATLWFVNATYLALTSEWQAEFASEAMSWFEEIFEWHHKGTFFGIHVDPEDGLLAQGVPGIQLTWMDAKVGDWVVTPRHGKPVEINGLWINALRVMEWLAQELGKPNRIYREAAELAEENMERKFWHEMSGHYLDTVDPDDASLRPNQVIAMALPFAPLKGENAIRALEKVTAELLTPMGLRTLGPKEPGYIGRFEGPLNQRDAAYHQGTVWPWLLGPYVSALIKLTDDRNRAIGALSHIVNSLDDYGLGGIAEVYDGDAPQRPGGCPWQAWSVGEVLRAWNECQ